MKKTGERARKKTSLPLAPKTQKLAPKRAPKGKISQEVHQSSQMPLNLKQVYEIVTNWPRNDHSVEVSINFDVFGHSCDYFVLFRDEIIEFCRKEMIGQACIVFYMRYAIYMKFIKIYCKDYFIEVCIDFNSSYFTVGFYTRNYY